MPTRTGYGRTTTTSSATTQAPTGTNPIPRLTALTPQNQPERPLLRGNQPWLGIQGVKTLSQGLLEGEINKKALSDFVLNGPGDLVLFGPFTEHLFRWVHDRADVEQESIPNRHAATHVGCLIRQSNPA